jgi:signal transduction histidine kinase/CheY-like chemotaxis protein
MHNMRLPLLALALGAVASLVLFLFVKDGLEKEAKLRFERQASDARHAIAARIQSYADVIYGLRSLYESSYPVTRAEFHRYVAGLESAERYPAIWGFNFAEYVPHQNKAAFVARVRKDTSLDPHGYPQFTVIPPGDRPEYYVVTYMEPMAGNESTLGLDISRNPAARDPSAIAEAMARGRDSGKMTSSGQIISASKPSLAMRLPVYRSGRPLKTIEQRRAAYLGSVGAAFYVRDLMRGVLDERATELIRFRFYEAGPAQQYTAASRPLGADRLLFDSKELSKSAGAVADESGQNSSFKAVLPIEVGGRVWEVHFSTPHKAVIAGIDLALPWLALGGGLLISTLLFAIFYSLAAAAQRVEVARGEAVAANIAKSKFLAAASHDLRQPMQALSMYTSVLEDRVSDARALRVVRGIELSVRALEQLFDSLLDISKIESGVIKPEIVSFALMPLFERVVEAEIPIAAQKNLELRVAATSASVRSDPALLERMLKNLVTNAIRYTERGKILVGCRRVRGGRLRIEVVDSGIGIPAHEQERIFDEYYQLGGKSVQGLGLGLPIVKSLGELLGHAVTVRSAPGRGSVFSIELGRAAEPVLPAIAPSAVPQSTLKAMNVVVVDDDVEIRNSIRLLLESWECRCIGGATAADVERELRTQRVAPDALIVDYRLADAMDGLQIIEYLRAAFGGELPALIITGTASLSVLQERAPGIRVAMKPVPPGKLRAFLSQSLRQRASGAPAGRIL